MKSIYRIFILAFILLLAMDNIYAGGGNRTGTGGAAQLLVPVGARGISMGSSNVATTAGVDALFWNPAGVARMEGNVNVSFSHMNYIADIGVEYGAVSANFEGFGVVSFSIKSISVGDIPVTTTQNPDGTGDIFTPQMLTAGLSYSRQLTDRIAVGITGNLVSERLGEVSATGIAFNVGVIYDNLANINGLNFGIVMKNIGPQMQFSGPGLYLDASAPSLHRPPQLYTVTSAPVYLPSSFEIGFGYKPQIDQLNSLQIATTFQNNNYSGDEYKLGLEYGYNNTFFVRGGYTLSPKSQDPDYIYGLTAGAGINYDMQGLDLKVDYAYRDVKYFEANHVFQISIGF